MLLLACAAPPDAPKPAAGGYPDPSFVWEVSDRVASLDDERYLQERASHWRTVDVLPDLDVRALAASRAAEVWVGTASGLYAFDGESFARLALAGPDGAVVDLAIEAGAVALADRVDRLDDGASWALADVRAVAGDADRLYAGAAGGLYELSGAGAAQLDATPILDLALTDDGTLWVATAEGIFRWSDTGLNPGGGALPDADIRAIAAIPGGGVAVACATGAALVGTATSGAILPGIGGLPTGDLRAVATAPGELSFGHAEGASVLYGESLLTGAHLDHYHGLRWLADDTVTAVAIDAAGARWFGGPAGVSRVVREEATLVDKAARFEALAAQHWRLDFVADGLYRSDPWDPAGAAYLSDYDNDGLWTQMMIGAWSYAAGTTADPVFCDNARRAMQAMYLQIDIPAVSFAEVGLPPGFVARSLVRDDETALFEQKLAEPNWHRVTWTDGHDYVWKDDTSSDETTGHFFGYPLFYDFCAADDAERAEVAAHVSALAGHIVDNGYRLVDLDGGRTTWGYWDPDHVNIALDGLPECLEDYPAEDCVGAAYGVAWLQSIEILGHLLAAWHVTGETRFYDAYEHLVTDERYIEAAMFNADVQTVTNSRLANHSDHELAMLAYHTLIRYEPDDARRQVWIDSLLAFYEWELPERNPLWATIVGAAVADGYAVADAVDTLRVWPEDPRVWTMDNAHRVDVALGSVDRFEEAQFTTVLPYDEIRTMKWNGNPYVASSGGDGTEVQGPWPWLLPYWMGRWHGVIR